MEKETRSASSVQWVDIDYVVGLRDGVPKAGAGSQMTVLKKYLEKSGDTYTCQEDCGGGNREIRVELHNDELIVNLVKEFNIQDYSKDWEYIIFWSDIQ